MRIVIETRTATQFPLKQRFLEFFSQGCFLCCIQARSLLWSPVQNVCVDSPFVLQKDHSFLKILQVFCSGAGNWSYACND